MSLFVQSLNIVEQKIHLCTAVIERIQI